MYCKKIFVSHYNWIMLEQNNLANSRKYNLFFNVLFSTFSVFSNWRHDKEGTQWWREEKAEHSVWTHYQSQRIAHRCKFNDLLLLLFTHLSRSQVEHFTKLHTTLVKYSLCKLQIHFCWVNSILIFILRFNYMVLSKVNEDVKPLFCVQF